MIDRRVALLRGVNLGRAKRVLMSDLRDLVASLGYRDVRTVLNSGNVVFTVPPALRRANAARRLETALQTTLGVSSRVLVLTASDLDGVLRENPLAGRTDNPSRLLVMFLMDPADVVRLTDLAAQDWTPEALAVGRGAAYLWCRDGIAGSKVTEAVGRALADRTTGRNWATVTKLHTLITS